ncbi:hypothetical protein N7491_003183 [Penicillium cf. griseofulvum]|uniref:Uncharacterized protein n=1 Tax=Penicillium cf. griseofulvum TaxID=2972120 RepID=A0A9W9T1V4_9EURO|nr:hypothetical protein N7472_002644 [Penicillium cf. griseofulvum]KAJ5440777.1 hypothetical protein N7491_003183 [Penicillium cf. griseofulvum]KAJ5448824.1 hypothetical protein N7445_003645 [Penicillium cf. griseofulvum]
MTKHFGLPRHTQTYGPPAVLRWDPQKDKQKKQSKHTVAQTTDTLEIGLAPASLSMISPCDWTELYTQRLQGGASNSHRDYLCSWGLNLLHLVH